MYIGGGSKGGLGFGMKRGREMETQDLGAKNRG